MKCGSAAGYLDNDEQQQAGGQRQAELGAQVDVPVAGAQAQHGQHAVPQQPPALLVRRDAQHGQLGQHHLRSVLPSSKKNFM